jgi:hypothetical protein
MKLELTPSHAATVKPFSNGVRETLTLECPGRHAVLGRR